MKVKCSCGDDTTKEFLDAFGSCRKCAEDHYSRLIEEQQKRIEVHKQVISGLTLLYDQISKYDLSELDG
jgi:hypothetical protein